MSETWIIFHAEPNQPGWEERKLPMGGLTDILNEQWDYSGRIPEVGERFRQFLRIEEFVEPQYPQSSTHSREGDWVVTRIERYPSGNADCSKREIVLCYCKFEPVLSALEPMGRGEPVAEMLEPVNA